MNQIILKTDYQRKQLLHYIKHLDISRPVVFSWKLWKGKRGLDQNALLHCWMKELIRHPAIKKANPTIEDMKTSMKERFLGRETVCFFDSRTGEEKEIVRIRRTRDLDSGEFNYFLQCIEQWAIHGLGVVLKSNKDDEYQSIQREQEGCSG